MAVIPALTGFWRVPAIFYTSPTVGDTLVDGYASPIGVATTTTIGDVIIDGYSDPARSTLQLSINDVTIDGYSDPPIKSSISIPPTIGEIAIDGYSDAPAIAARANTTIGEIAIDGYSDPAVRGSITADLTISDAAIDGYSDAAIKGDITVFPTIGDATVDGYMGEEPLDFSGFSDLPASDEAALEAAGVTQVQINAAAAGQLWWFSPANLYSNTAATTLIAGTAGNQIAAWKSWNGDLLTQATAGNRPTYQTDGVQSVRASNQSLLGTVTPNVKLLDNTVCIALLQFTSTTSNQDWIGNADGVAGRWFLRQENSTTSRYRTSNGINALSGSTPATSLQFQRFERADVGTDISLYANGVSTLTQTNYVPPSFNNDPNQIRLFAQSSSATAADLKVRALFVGNISTAQAALVEQLIEAIAGTSLLP